MLTYLLLYCLVLTQPAPLAAAVQKGARAQLPYRRDLTDVTCLIPFVELNNYEKRIIEGETGGNVWYLFVSGGSPFLSMHLYYFSGVFSDLTLWGVCVGGWLAFPLTVG